MSQRPWYLIPFALLLIVAGISATSAAPVHPQAANPPTPFEWNDTTYNTVIVVDTVEDNSEDSLDLSASETCADVADDPVDSRCTLRRAIVQSQSVPSGERPVLIAFDLPAAEANDPNSPQYWEMQITRGVDSPLGGGTGQQIEGGSVTLDGSTQGALPDATGPQGRTNEPPIFIPGTPDFDSFKVGNNNNLIRYIGFQGLKLSFTGGSNNIAEELWLGLTSDGNSIYFINDDAEVDNKAVIEELETSSNNIYRNNVITGGRTDAITKRGDNGEITNNLIGTRADGTVPEVPSNRYCKPNAQFSNWFGGAGLQISGASNLVADNRIVGLLFASGDVATTPDPAIILEDGDNTVRNNIIGVDSAGQEFGTCGRGIDLTDRGNLIENNELVNVQLQAAINIRGATENSLGANTIRGNVVRGNTPESIYILPRVPNDYEYFNPAKVTSIDGAIVTGESGDPGEPPDGSPVDSTCESCTIEIFLDDTDAFNESLESLGTVQADGTGGWVFTLDTPLQDGQGLRTTSTSVANNQIGWLEAGATTKTSVLYGPDGVITQDPPPPPPPLPEPPDFSGLLAELEPAPDTPTPTFTTTVTVDTTADYNISRSETCTSEADAPTDSGCSLRRAIIEASTAGVPALIEFNIPESDPNYDSASGTWLIEMQAVVGSGELEVNGQVTINGFSQPGGRPDLAGPNVFVRGSAQFSELVLRGDSIIVRGLGWQQMELNMASSDNFIEQNWLGLTRDGTSIYFINNDPTSDNDSTIQSASGTARNVVRGNIVAGARDRLISLRGGDSWIVNNNLGTDGNGSVPAPPTGTLLCDPGPSSGSWFGGAGILVAGSGFQVYSNTVGSTLIASAGGAVQPPAIETQGSFSVVQENVIGRDTDGNDGSTCGVGIRADGSLHRFEANTIVGGLQGFLTAGVPSIYRENLLLDNVEPTAYTEELKDLSNYNPARVTAIEETDQAPEVSGTNGSIFVDPVTGEVFDPTCPYCTIQLFSDRVEDTDPTSDAREVLAVTTSDERGDWTTTLSRPLAEGEGIRTMTITGDYASIRSELIEVGFTTKLSEELYDPETVNQQAVFLPLIIR
jgi:hypothetical protein